MATKDDMLVDKRIIERNIKKGILSREDFTKHLEKLSDAADNMELVALETPEETEGSEEAPAPAAPEAVEPTP